MKELVRKFALVGAICLGALIGVAATGKSAAFPLDLAECDRPSAGTEELTFSNLCDGDAGATVTIARIPDAPQFASFALTRRGRTWYHSRRSGGEIL